MQSYRTFGVFIVVGFLSASLAEMSAVTGTFYYFAFGSNLLAKRIHIQNPTAVRKGYGYLKDYSLDFFHYAARWRGAPATIVEQKGEEVWGAIWEIDNSNLADLDRQEGVHNSVYKPLTLPVVLPGGDTLECRVYQLVKNPCCLAPDADRPYERQPSKTYMNIIINGAKETGLPEDYIALLKRIKHNGNTGDPQLSMELEKPIEE
ncbi:gamma-glutamylcyclotransferase-like isoform X1 [Anopheles ziemanni]|uniref:gamma-glutamylcyclotransferase-like isoform X1 n=2 Tax=Anopheles coustani TaxID=139045 RepID=UPI002658E8D8|nr:gamma-glutamylcyclotransferase-like isoform X1 [Anopheles coustani]XP_058172226.1 gamma-glutamylcyclotransferase-like isoform X1 [Anopheles ziemanni]